MREKIILQDFNVLLVCPSQKWSTIERRVLFDSTFLRNSGGNPVILCFKGSQLDIEAENEDIPRVYIKRKMNIYLGAQFFFELRKLLKEEKFDIVHCYSLFPIWLSSMALSFYPSTPLFLTFNQRANFLPFEKLSKLLLRRVDYIFTFSKEVEDFVRETYPIPPKKLRNLGAGIERSINERTINKDIHIGCIVNNLAELRTLHFPIKTFRLLKTSAPDKWENTHLYIFLGPRVYKKERAKNVLTELDYEFYKGDIHLVNLKGKESLLKSVDIFFGTAFDEPLNDYEMASLLDGVPVLFPRTAMRQSLLQKYPGIGESYQEGDSREARVKLLKLLAGLGDYHRKLKDFSGEISDVHGLESYAERLQKFYEMAFAKRLRLAQKKGSH